MVPALQGSACRRGTRGAPGAALTAVLPQGRCWPSTTPSGPGRAGPGVPEGAERRALSVVLKRAAVAAPGLRPPENATQDCEALTFNYVNPTFRALKLNRHRNGEGWGIIYCLVISLCCSCCSYRESSASLGLESFCFYLKSSGLEHFPVLHFTFSAFCNTLNLQASNCRRKWVLEPKSDATP